MHILGTRVRRCLGLARSASSPKALRLHPAVSGSGVRCGRACWGLGFSCAPPLLLGVLGCVCARAPVPRGLLHLLVWGVLRGCAFVRAPRLFPAFPGWGVLCGRACRARVSAVPRPSWLGCRGVFFFWACLAFGLWCRLLAVPVPGLVVPVPPSRLFRAGLLALFLFFCPPRGVCLHVLVSLLPVGRCSWFGVACFGWVVLLCPFGGPVFGAFWLGGVAASCGVGGRFGGCGPFSRPPPPVFFLGGGVCLFLPLPLLGWRTHWPAFSVVFRVAVGGCVLLGRVPAPWVGWAMYTLGSAPLPAGLGPGPAGWATAPGSFVWLWVRGLGLSVSFLLRGAGFNLLAGPQPLMPGARWPRVWPAVPVCGVLVRRLPGCALACFG